MFSLARATGWPAVLTGRTPGGAQVALRPLTADDRDAFETLRRTNLDWLGPWDATSPDGSGPRTFAEMLKRFRAEATAGRMLPFAIEHDGGLVGQLTIGNVILGSFRSATAGYWISRHVAGRGLTTTALALAADHCFEVLHLHRLEVNIRPENAASLAVARKLGLRDEGLRRRMLHIDGAWRDHRSFAVTVEELAGGRLIDRLNHQ